MPPDSEELPDVGTPDVGPTVPASLDAGIAAGGGAVGKPETEKLPSAVCATPSELPEVARGFGTLAGVLHLNISTGAGLTTS